MAGVASAKKIVALVTGGASGLGKATVLRLVSKGYNVGLVDLPVSAGQKMADEIGQQVIFTPTDISVDEQVKKAVDSTAEHFGTLNVVVNCAGIAFAQKLYSPSKRQMMELERIQKTLNVNVLGTINVIRHALPHMVANQPDEHFSQQRGVIINTSSIAAYEGQQGQVVYSATKGAIAAMTLPLARDNANSNIRVVAIAPGLMNTPLMNSLPEKAKKFLASTVPFPPRLGEPDDFAALVEHILENPYINGTVIRLDGALRMP